MGLKGLFAVSGCVVFGFFIGVIVLVVVLLALFIELFLPFGKDQAWAWMLGKSQPTSPPVVASNGGGQPVIVGAGEWCVTKAYQETPDQDHNNHGRVQGYVRDAYGNPLAGVPVHVGWDGDEGGITEYTDANGYYVIILSPGSYYVTIGDGRASSRVYFRTNIKARYGHITYDVDFQLGVCSYQIAAMFDDPRQPCGTPVEGPITATFRDPNYFQKFKRTHNGVDIAVPIGTPVHATMHGKVIGAGYFPGGYGYMVLVQNGPWQVFYEHLSKANVMLGDMIAVGQTIGWSGNSGDSTGPHVHYEVHYNGFPVDPLSPSFDAVPATLCATAAVLFGDAAQAEAMSSPSTISSSAAVNTWSLTKFPQPRENSGQCVHWFPTPKQKANVVDTFVPIVREMGMQWILFLQDPNEPNANDYLLLRLREAGIMPIARIMAPIGPLDLKMLGATVSHQHALGVRYFQIFNEPNNTNEWSVPTRSPQLLARYWIDAAQVVMANGGLPGLPPFATDNSDLEFFRRTLTEINAMTGEDLLRGTWLAVHTYGDMNDGGFFQYRQYQQIVQRTVGRTLPVLSTEGGMGTAEQTAQIVNAQFEFVRTRRESALFAYCPWLIGNSVGGGKDLMWEPQAWCVGALDKPICRVTVNPAVLSK